MSKTRKRPNDSDSSTPKLIAAPLASPLLVEGAIAALRMVEGQRWYRHLLSHDGLRDHDILILVGLEMTGSYGDRLTATELRNAFRGQLNRLEKRERKPDDLLTRNIRRMGVVLGLSTIECRILRLAVITTRVPQFKDLFRLTLVEPADILRAVNHATGINLSLVQNALSQNHILRRSGFLEDDARLHGMISNPIEVDGAIYNALLSSRLDNETILRKLIRKAQPATVALPDFGHIDQIPILQRYLEEAVRRRRRGVNVLLYGAAGTGKTECARALAPAIDAQLYEVPNQNGEGEAISGKRRFNAYSICQSLLKQRRGQMLLFDEVEDVFGTVDFVPHREFMHRNGFGDPEILRKSWVNEILETNPVPAIWICNSIGGIDPAFLRRFDLVVEFRVPGREVRRRVIDRYFKRGEISENCATRPASIEYLPPAQVERAARVARSLRTRDASKRDSEVERVLRGSLKALGHDRTLPAPTLPAYYQPEFLNTDRDLAAITRGLHSRADARLCLFGPPGTGKTAFAHHLGVVLDRPVLVRRASDLLDMYVGQTEAKIREAFEQARDDKAILVIDEADSFLRDRSTAQRSWEVTQVNELLTQMEAFDGIFVASTNLIDTLDAASLRRFDFKVKFDYLTRDQRRAMLRRVAVDASDDQPTTSSALAQIDRLDQLTPGDFANVLRQLQVTRETATAARIVELLTAEAAMKPDGRRAKIGFVN